MEKFEGTVLVPTDCRIIKRSVKANGKYFHHDYEWERWQEQHGRYVIESVAFPLPKNASSAIIAFDGKEYVLKYYLNNSDGKPEKIIHEIKDEEGNTVEIIEQNKVFQDALEVTFDGRFYRPKSFRRNLDDI